MNSGDLTCVFGIVFLVASAICYAIAMGVGWALAVNVYPGTVLIWAAAIITSIPVLCILAVLRYGSYLECCGNSVSEAAANCVICIVMMSGVFEAVGGALFIANGALIKVPRVPAYGISAGVFGILAAFAFVISQCCWYHCLREMRKGAGNQS